MLNAKEEALQRDREARQRLLDDPFEQQLRGRKPGATGTSQSFREGRRQRIWNTEKLSKRELEVVRLLADGLNYVEIADRLFVSRETVKSHIVSALRKKGMRNSHGLVGSCLREGIIK